MTGLLPIRNPLACGSCSHVVEAGTTVNCPKCGKTLRPIVLGVISILGIVVSLFAFCVSGALLLRGKTGSVFFILISAVSLPTFYGLMKGKYVAWAALQLLLGWGVAVWLLMAAVIIFDSSTWRTGLLVRGWPVLAVPLVILFAVWRYVRTPRVAEFCSGGKP